MTEDPKSGPTWTVGSLTDEATQLLDALKKWVDHQASQGPDNAFDSGTDPGMGHGDSCRFCPICQVAGALRKTHPEAVEQFSRATESLLAAIRATIVSHEKQWGGRPPPDVEEIRIDVGE